MELEYLIKLIKSISKEDTRDVEVIRESWSNFFNKYKEYIAVPSNGVELMNQWLKYRLGV